VFFKSEQGYQLPRPRTSYPQRITFDVDRHGHRPHAELRNKVAFDSGLLCGMKKKSGHGVLLDVAGRSEQHRCNRRRGLRLSTSLALMTQPPSAFSGTFALAQHSVRSRSVKPIEHRHFPVQSVVKSFLLLWRT